MGDLLVSAIKSTAKANSVRERAIAGELRARRRGDHAMGDKYKNIIDRCEERSNAFGDLLKMFKKCDGWCKKCYLILIPYKNKRYCAECLEKAKEEDK